MDAIPTTIKLMTQRLSQIHSTSIALEKGNSPVKSERDGIMGHGKFFCKSQLSLLFKPAVK